MSETYPRKTLCETLFAGHTPSRVGFGCKGTKKNAYAQVLCDFFCLVDGTLRLLFSV